MSNPYMDLVPQDSTVSAGNPYADLIPKADTTASTPASSRNAAFDADTKARLGQVVPSLSGLVHGIVDPFVTLAKEGAYQIAPNSALLQKYVKRPTTAETLMAAPQAAISAVAPGAYEEMNAIKSPLMRVGAKALAGSGIGAVFSPDNMKQGALTGAVLGGAGGVAEDMGGIQKSIGGLVDPETAAQAAQVPALTAERDIANARADAGLQSLEALNRRVSPREAPSVVQGPAPSRAFAEWDNLLPEQQAEFGSRDGYVASRRPLSQSVVRDAAGKLIEVYHGTRAQYEVPDIARSGSTNLFGRGHYTTESPEIASTPGYTGQFGVEGSAPNVHKQFLDIRNPFRLDAELAHTGDTPELENLFVRYERANGRMINADFVRQDLRKRVRGVATYGDVWKSLRSMHATAGGYTMPDPTMSVGNAGDLVNANLQKAGYDGLTHIGTGGKEFGPHRVWIAWDPSQIHSAYSDLAAYHDLSVAPQSTPVQIGTHESDAVSGASAARAEEPHTPVDGPAPDPVPAGGLAATATREPSPAQPDPQAQPALHDQVARPAAFSAADHEGRMPWEDGYGTDQAPVDAQPQAPRQLATRDSQGRLVRNLKNVPLDDLHQEYSNIADARGSNPAVAPWARQTEYGTTVSGTSRANWAANSQAKAMDRIEAEIQRRGAEVEYRNAGLSGLPRRAYDWLKNKLDRPYASLEHDPADFDLLNNLKAAGAGAAHGADVATIGMHYVRGNLPQSTVKGIEARLFADNFEMQAQSREAAGDHAAATNLRAHADLAAADAPAGIESTPEYQDYIARYREKMEPHYNWVAKATGLSDANFRDVKPGSAYVPLPADIEAAPPDNAVRSSLRRNTTALSSATKVATGGANAYVLDAQHAAQTFLPERTRIAAQNELWQAVRNRGRALGGPNEMPMDGERRIAFTDKNQLTTPDAPDAAHWIALPEHAADAVKQYIDRRDAPVKRGGLNRELTTLTTLASPAIGLTHGGSIAQTVNTLPGPLTAAEGARVAASAAPFGNTLSGIRDLNGVDFTDPQTVDNYLAVSKYGGTRPQIARPEPTTAIGRAVQKVTGWGHKGLFDGPQSIDVRGRAVAANRLLSDPEMHPAEAAQRIGQAYGQYNPLNQPGAVYTGQRTGLTSFAPAGIGFTTEAVKRATGQRGVLPFVKQVAGPVAGLTALNYAMSGHSPLQNAPGHRGDIDLGYEGANGEQYLKSSYAYPLLNRAANTVGARPALEGEGFSGAASGAANEALQQLGVVPRMALAAVNSQPHVKSTYDGLEPLVKPQVGESNRFLKIMQKGAAPMIGAAGDVGGFSSFDADQPVSSRILNAIHANAIASGGKIPRTNNDVKSQDYQDKVSEGSSEIGHADDPDAKVQELMARAKSDGFSPIQIQVMYKQWARSAALSKQQKGQLHQKSIAKKGFISATP